ncbi:MAG: zf-TFIIB domain-containing protein [Actinomycetes bacterium]
MKCPVDNRELLITHRDGIELDYCPECRGVWFDRGELDKVIERSNEQLHISRAQAAPVPREQRVDYEPKKKKKASSFLSDLLEFG